jgi:hypothetical protein
LFFKVTGVVAAVLYGTRGVCQKEKMFCLNNSSLNNNNAIDKVHFLRRLLIARFKVEILTSRLCHRVGRVLHHVI